MDIKRKGPAADVAIKTNQWGIYVMLCKAGHPSTARAMCAKFSSTIIPYNLYI